MYSAQPQSIQTQASDTDHHTHPGDELRRIEDLLSKRVGTKSGSETAVVSEDDIARLQGRDERISDRDRAATSSMVVGGKRATIQPRKKYLVIEPVPGNPNARSLMPSESRRHAELWQLVEEMRADPDRTPVAEIRRVLDEIDTIASVSAMGGEVRRTLWMPLLGQGEPSDSEAIVLDLRR